MEKHKSTLFNIQLIIPMHCDMSWLIVSVVLSSQINIHFFWVLHKHNRLRILPRGFRYLLWIFYEKFLNEVFGRLRNWWKCFFRIIHVNLRYIKVSFLIISSHKRRLLRQQHVGNYTYVPEIRTQRIILPVYLNNIPPVSVVLQIKPPDVCHTQRIRNIMWHLTCDSSIHAHVHTRKATYISRWRDFWQLLTFKYTLFFPLRLLGKGNLSLLHSPFLDTQQLWMIGPQEDRLAGFHVNKTPSFTTILDEVSKIEI